MSSARVIAPTNIGIHKLLTIVKVNAVIERTANAVIQGMGFIVDGVVGLSISGGGVPKR